MSGQFAGKTVAITGAAGGIGQSLCRFFGQAGATIAALDRNPKVVERRDELGKEGNKTMAAGGALSAPRGPGVVVIRTVRGSDQQRGRLAPPDACCHRSSCLGG